MLVRLSWYSCTSLLLGLYASSFLTVWSQLWRSGPRRSTLVCLQWSQRWQALVCLQWNQRWHIHPSRKGNVLRVAPQVLLYVLRRPQASPIRSPHLCQQRNRGLLILAHRADWPPDSYAIICGVGRQQARFSSTQRMPYRTVLRRIRTLLL